MGRVERPELVSQLQPAQFPERSDEEWLGRDRRTPAGGSGAARLRFRRLECLRPLPLLRHRPGLVAVQVGGYYVT
eukprot:974753-Rhodomonas_salina.1